MIVAYPVSYPYSLFGPIFRPLTTLDMLAYALSYKISCAGPFKLLKRVGRGKDSNSMRRSRKFPSGRGGGGGGPE